jgi:hypothetical protein
MKGRAMADSEDKRKLKDIAHKRMNKLFDELLFSIEPAVRNDYVYSVLRKRVLRAGNNALRDLHAYIDQIEIIGQGESRTFEIYKVEDEGDDK